MASLHYCAPAPHLIGSLRRTSAGVNAPSLTFFNPLRCNLPVNVRLRFRTEVRLQAKQGWSPVFASNNNTSEGSDNAKASGDSTASGPPFLTILAGLLVFVGICWVIGSIVVWLVGLIVHPPPLK